MAGLLSRAGHGPDRVRRISTINAGASRNPASKPFDRRFAWRLFLAAALLCGGASGEIFGSPSDYRILKTISAGAAIILLLFSAMYYADVTVAQLFGKAIDSALVEKTSLQVLVGSVAIGSICVALGAFE